MQRYRNNKIHIICNLLVIFAALTAVFAIGFYRQLNKHMSEICEYKGRETANNIITSAIEEQLEGSGSEYITVVRDENGSIVSIDTKTAKINKIQNKLKKTINEKLSDINNNQMSLPIGTLTGITLFSGVGPDVKLQLHQVGAVDIEAKSEFVSAGINQTKYRLFLTVTVELSAILPTHSTDIKVNNDYLITETIIVGEIPDAYISSNKI